MKLKIISQTKKLYEGEIEMVTVPGVEGQMGILPGHANLISTLDVGEVKIKEQRKEIFLAINGGILEVKNDKIIILANEAALAEDILEEEIEQAVHHAEKQIASDLPASELIQHEKQLRYQKFKMKLKKKIKM